ncbi:MAG: PIN domain-containing protein [bacterium]|nr:PIN domain-containing protein [bacterium]
MACLDTSFLIDLLRGEEKVEGLYKDLIDTEIRLCIAAPSIMEIWSGACSANTPKEKEKVLALIRGLEILDLSLDSAKEAGEIEASLRKKGKIIDTEDCMIAGIAKLYGEKVVTGDIHFSYIDGLKVLKY